MGEYYLDDCMTEVTVVWSKMVETVDTVSVQDSRTYVRRDIDITYNNQKTALVNV